MYLFPFKIFTLSKNKRLFNINEPDRTIGIYDANTYKYKEAANLARGFKAKVSILLGNIFRDIKLICLDLDDCFTDSGDIEPLTKEFLKEFKDEEWEVSSSGTGIHIYILTKQELNTFIVKDLEGCKSFECYTNKRHIVTTNFKFLTTSLVVGAHDKFLEDLYSRVEKQRSLIEEAKLCFDGTIIKDEKAWRLSRLAGREPVTDMYKLRGLGLKDPMIIEVIDQEPSVVDQSAWDAKLVKKLMYYTFSFDDAWEMAKKTNYYKHKDERHKKKFNSEVYKERTRRYLNG